MKDDRDHHPMSVGPHTAKVAGQRLIEPGVEDLNRRRGSVAADQGRGAGRISGYVQQRRREIDGRQRAEGNVRWKAVDPRTSSSTGRDERSRGRRTEQEAPPSSAPADHGQHPFPDHLSGAAREAKEVVPSAHRDRVLFREMAGRPPGRLTKLGVGTRWPRRADRHHDEATEMSRVGRHLGASSGEERRARTMHDRSCHARFPFDQRLCRALLPWLLVAGCIRGVGL
jgi:hypothetical protein